MSVKAKCLWVLALLVLSGGAYYAGYLKGWYAHSEHINRQAAAQKARSEKAVAASEQKAAVASAEGKVIYRTIYRDVVKYVNDQSHVICRFDANAVRLRQQAIDAANSISGFDAGTVQGE